MIVDIFTDGGSRGNPGPAAIGAVILDQEGNRLEAISEYIGSTTNNQAEYQAIVAALERAVEIGATAAHCYLDSKLVVEQVNGNWKIKKAALRPHVDRIHELQAQFEEVTFTHVRREKNTAADEQVNIALDKWEENQ